MGASDDLLEKLAQFRVIPVIAIDAVESSLPLADALLAGGLPLAEITFRSAAAGEVIATLTRERPKLLVGAGTVLSVEDLERARERGAEFGVAPGLNPAVVSRAKELGLPFIPGVVTPSEIEQAMSLGCRVLKFFPAEQSGGTGMIKALTAPYAHAGVRFVPTGGVNMANLPAYLALESVIAIGGTWIAPREDIVHRRWEEIAERCRAVAEATRRLKG